VITFSALKLPINRPEGGLLMLADAGTFRRTGRTYTMQIRQQDVSFTRNGLKKTEDSVIWSVQFLEVTHGVTQDEPAFCLHLCYDFSFDAMDKLSHLEYGPETFARRRLLALLPQYRQPLTAPNPMWERNMFVRQIYCRTCMQGNSH
jgi:hypothetical protein